MISVALCTCNGASFLPELLASLVKQKHQPFEVIACDDASDDDTVSILENFAATRSLVVHIRRNPIRLGVVKNFSHAITACRGEYIALADQDDVWHPNKLEHLARALAPSNSIAAFSDARLVDAKLVPLNYTMWQRVRFTRLEQSLMTEGDGFSVLLKHHLVTGATLAFKATLREIALPIPANWEHDAWLAAIAAAQGNLIAINEELIAYRQHTQNVVGGRQRSLVEDARSALELDRSAWYRKELARWRELEERLGTFSCRQAASQTLAEKITHLETRANLPLPRWQRLPGILHELTNGRYTRYARNWGSAAIDLLVK